MSNIYIVEPPTSGKVVLVTTKGDIEIELWAKECPKTCRNFIGLGMEGYYEGTTFHRIVPGFIVQGGDPTATGHGGESIYGKPFKDEIHQRLKFTRRGLLGMANSGKNDNGSQFFITLDRADELDKKHTLFGKVVGDTIFNVLKMAEAPLDDNERPEEPIVIKRMDVIDNPFDDLVPRPEVLAAKEALRAADAAREHKKKRSKVKAIKKFSLVSFGDEAEADEEQYSKLKGMKSSHSVLKDDPRLKAEADPEDLVVPEEATKRDKTAKRKSSSAAAATGDAGTVIAPIAQLDDENMEFDRQMREKLMAQRPGYVGSGVTDAASTLRTKEDESKTSAQRTADAREEAELLEEELREAKRASKRAKVEMDEASRAPASVGSAFLSEQRAKYASRGASGAAGKAGKSRREADTLALLDRFKSKLFTGGERDGSAQDESAQKEPRKQLEHILDPNSLLSDDDEDDADWMSHTLSNEAYQRPKGIEPEKDPYSLDLHDPRHPMNIRRREESKKSAREKRRPRNDAL